MIQMNKDYVQLKETMAGLLRLKARELDSIRSIIHNPNISTIDKDRLITESRIFIKQVDYQIEELRATIERANIE